MGLVHVDIWYASMYHDIILLGRGVGRIEKKEGRSKKREIKRRKEVVEEEVEKKKREIVVGSGQRMT